MLELDHYLSLRTRPAGRPVMRQNWRDLSFLHLRYEPEEIQNFVPPKLTVDTFPDENGKEWAWLAIVPFWMTSIRLPWLPPIPGTHTFCETNVRTYVHHKGQQPGVWFFSLDAANALACRVARRFFQLPYFFAEMSCKHEGDNVHYESTRLWGEPYGFCGTTQITSPIQTATPGTLEFFLAERYLLYAQRERKLFTGIVSHVPYPLQSATCVAQHSMLRQFALPDREDWDHVLFSPGVDVEIFPIKPL
jgi:uncharacterized protein YqjF (DUF2071 family)